MPTEPARPPIVFIGNVTPEEEQTWLDALRREMPQERLLSAAAITDDSEIELAIVANPDPAVVRRFRGLKWVQSLWAGVERLVAEPAFDSLPVVRMVDPELARTMAEAVLAWTLYLHRDMPAYLAQQRQASWRQLPYVPPSRRRVGLLGLGALGSAAARTLRDAGFDVSGWRRSPKPGDGLDGLDGIARFHGREGLMAMAPRTDILVCLLPLTNETRHLVDASLLKTMPPGACLINFGRGPVLRTQDLIAALDAGHLQHAVLDVFDEEPLPAESPLWRHPGLTLLPHVSADTDSSTASRIVAGNVRRWRDSGELPQPVVDRQRGY